MAPIAVMPDEAEEYVSYPEDYGPEPAYADDQEQEIARLVSVYNDSYLNDDPTAPNREDVIRTGHIRIM
jgi:hypothetical protein